MRVCFAVVLLLCVNMGLAQVPQAPGRGSQSRPAYPEPEAVAAWRALAASYVRKAIREQKLDRDPVLNARVDAVMAAVGAAVAEIDPRFAGASWHALLIEDFGHGAAAFPGETILIDAKFVRSLALGDDELALILSHEAAHVIAGHASEKLSFMAEFLGKDRIPTARTALLEFLARDSYAEVFQPKAQLQEREADTAGAAIMFAAGFDPQRAMKVFDKLIEIEARETVRTGQKVPDSHDSALARRQAVSGVIADLQALQARSVSPPR